MPNQCKQKYSREVSCFQWLPRRWDRPFNSLGAQMADQGPSLETMTHSCLIRVQILNPTPQSSPFSPIHWDRQFDTAHCQWGPCQCPVLPSCLVEQQNHNETKPPAGTSHCYYRSWLSEQNRHKNVEIKGHRIMDGLMKSQKWSQTKYPAYMLTLKLQVVLGYNSPIVEVCTCVFCSAIDIVWH